MAFIFMEKFEKFNTVNVDLYILFMVDIRYVIYEFFTHKWYQKYLVLF